MTPRARYVVLYVVLIAIVAALTAFGLPSREVYVTAARLVPNHRIARGDVVEAGWWHRFLTPSLGDVGSYRGRYVRTQTPIPAHAGIVLADTADTPHPSPPPHLRDAVLLWVPFAPEAADQDALDAGSLVDVCGIDAQDRCVSNLTVGAIACGGTARASCFAGIWAGAANRATLLRALDARSGAHVRLLVRHTEENG